MRFCFFNRRLCYYAFFFFLCFFIFSFPLHAQESVTIGIVSSTFPPGTKGDAYRRPFLETRKLQPFARMNPLTYITGTIIYLYQNILSEQLQADCIYVVSCSTFTRRSMEHRGVLIGLLAGMDQMHSCAPSVVFDFPGHLVTPAGRIINEVPAN